MKPRPLRILQLITRPQRRGAEIFARDLCDVLERRGHATRIVALYRTQGGHELPLRSHDLRLDGDGRSALEKIPGFHPGLLRRLLAAVDDFAPDVVQVNGSRTVKYGSLLRRLRREAPWVMIYRSIGTPEDWLRNPLRRLLYRRLVIAPMDSVVAVSRNTLRSLERCYRLQVPTVVLPRAVAAPPANRPGRAAVRRKLGTSPEVPVLLFAGRLSREKRPDRLLRVGEAIARMRRKRGLAPPELWIAGDGPLRNDVQRRAVTSGLPVRLLGEREDVLDLMEAADLLLLTSDTEGLPGVVLEAGSVGVPAVVTRVGGVEECVADGESGRVVAPEDETGLARAAASLLADDLHRHALGEAARRLVAERFSLPVVADGYLEHYRRLLAGRERRGR